MLSLLTTLVFSLPTDYQGGVYNYVIVKTYLLKL